MESIHRYLKYLAISVSAIAGLLIIGSVITLTSSKAPVIKAPTKTIDSQAFLDEKEAEAWAQLKKLNIDKATVVQKAQGLRKKITKRHIDKSIATSTRTLVDTVLTQSGIDPETIALYHREKSYSAAAAGNSCLYITQDIFNGLTQQAKKFVIGHEAQHIINSDTLVLQVVEEFTDHLKLNPTSPDCPINYLSRFFEFRADIRAASLGAEFAQGYVERAHGWLKNNADFGTCHPKHAERLAWAQKISGSVNQSPVGVA